MKIITDQLTFSMRLLQIFKKHNKKLNNYFEKISGRILK